MRFLWEGFVDLQQGKDGKDGPGNGYQFGVWPARCWMQSQWDGNVEQGASAWNEVIYFSTRSPEKTATNLEICPDL